MTSAKMFCAIVAAAGVAVGASATLAQDWSEDFEAYSVGQVLYNVGGWTGWDDLESVAGSVTNETAHGGTKSMRVENTDDAIHPFVPPYESGTGTLTHWVYHPVSEFFADSYCIYQSVYNHGGPYDWVVEIQFDFDSGAKVLDDFRPETNDVSMVFDQWIELRVEVDFAADTCTTFYNGIEVSTGALWYDGSPDQWIANPDMFTVGASLLYDDISVTGLSNGSGGGFALAVDMPNGCPGPITVSWTGSPGTGQQALVVGNSQGSTTIPQNQPCPGTVLGIQGQVQLVDPPGFFSNQGGAGSISGQVRNAGVCGKFLQAVKGGTCETSTVVQIN